MSNLRKLQQTNGTLLDIVYEIACLNGEGALKKSYEWIITLLHVEIWLTSDYYYAVRFCIELILLLFLVYYIIELFYYYKLCSHRLIVLLKGYHEKKLPKRLD